MKILAGAAVLALIGVSIYMAKNHALPRGIRNNNPLNLEFNQDINWNGQTGTDGRFATFDKAHNGIRAAARNMRTHRIRDGLNTIALHTYKWAPPLNDKGEVENDTEAYITSLEKQTGIFRHQFLTLDDYPVLIAAMIRHENGQQPYDLALIKAAVADGMA